MRKTTVQLGGAFALLVIVVIAYGIWYAEIRAQSAKAVELTQQVKERSQATTRVAAAKAELAKLAPEESEVNQYFISTNDVVSFLEQLAQTGKFLGADVEVASVSATPGTPYGSLNISLKITGSFQAVMRTLGSIEYGPYDIRTTSVTLDGGSSSDPASAGQWSAAAMFVISTQAPSKTAPVSVPTHAPLVTSSSSSPPATTSTTSTTHPASVSTTTGSGVATPTI